MKTILLVLGSQSGQYSKGDYNLSLFDTAKTLLGKHYKILTTKISEGYTPTEEVAKFKQADVVIYQYPIYWFMMPAAMKQYIDSVYLYDEFFAFNENNYGSGGLMTGKQFMLSTTWNAPIEAFNNNKSFFDGLSVDDVLLPMRKTHQYCGFKELVHFSSHNVIETPNFEKNREDFISHLNRVLL